MTISEVVSDGVDEADTGELLATTDDSEAFTGLFSVEDGRALDVVLKDFADTTFATVEELDTILVSTLLENAIEVIIDDGTTPDVDAIICVELDMFTVSIAMLGGEMAEVEKAVE